MKEGMNERVFRVLDQKRWVVARFVRSTWCVGRCGVRRE